MDQSFFQNFYKSLQMPVVVTRHEAPFSIVYANAAAHLLLDPLLTYRQLEGTRAHSPLGDLLSIRDPEDYRTLVASLSTNGALVGFSATIVHQDGVAVPISIDANAVSLGEDAYFVLYLRPVTVKGDDLQSKLNILSSLFQLANQSDSVDEGINEVLGYLGMLVGVSRVYIFEEISPSVIRNTYEWCAPGIEPAIGDLQNLEKTESNFTNIIERGVFVSDDITTLPAEDCAVLAAQGIRSLAILPLVYLHRPIGYIGFDDCVTKRHWTQSDLDLLKSASYLIVTLIGRRISERDLIRSGEVLKTITDSIENIIYVNDVHTYELVFMNRTLASTLDASAGQLIGEPCYRVLQAGMEGPCPFCPMPKMLREGYDKSRQTYTWEFQNTRTNRWYLLKDSIVPWTDGRTVHIETATEITHQKVYEERLKHYASTDIMTDTFNRDWGMPVIESARREAEQAGDPMSLLFFDVDNLKQTNDTYGHDAGDDLIIRTVDIVRGCIRKTDLICRWGGDEFLVMLRCNEQIAARIATKILGRMDAFNSTGEKPYALGISYGIVSLTDSPGSTLDALVTLADKRMYANKMARKDRP